MPAPSPARFRLNATTVSSHFKYRCDRRFRWNAVPTPLRGRPGIGWGAHEAPREGSRPGIQALMAGGDAFEVREVQALRDAHGEAFVWAGLGIDPRKKTEAVGTVSFDAFLDVLRRPDGVRFVAQPQLGYDERWRDETGTVHTATPEQRAENAAIEAAFLPDARLDVSRVALGLSRPDLVEFVTPDPAKGQTKPRLRVWDFKASREPRHEHFVQVAWYTFLLDAVLRSQGIDTVEVDHEVGAIRSYAADRDANGVLQEADPTFDLAPYRLAIEDFLRQRAPEILSTPADRAHYHVCDTCLACEHLDRCRAEADASFDVSRLPYLSSDGKRRLVEAGLATHRDVARLGAAWEAGDPGAADVAEALQLRSHDLKLHLKRHVGAALALDDGQERWDERPSLVVPRYESVRIVFSAERDAVSHRAFAFGFKTTEGWDEATRRFRGEEKAYVSEREGDEADLLDRFLTDLFGVLERFDAQNRAIDDARIPEDDAVDEAVAAYDALLTRKEQLEAEKAALGSKRDAHTSARRQQLTQEIAAIGKGPKSGQRKDAGQAIQKARSAAAWARQQRKVSVQLYTYDPLDLRILSEAVERHLFDPDTPAERYATLRQLARLMPPASVLNDPQTFRSLPIVVVQSVLRQHVALPVPYHYDLATVSARFRGQREDGSEKGVAFGAPYGFLWESSNQLAFERIHDVWNGRSFVHATSSAPGTSRTGAVTVGRERTYDSEAIRRTLEEGVRSKLRATDSVVSHLRVQMRDRGLLLFYKETFVLYDGFDPKAPLDGGAARLLDALHVFTILEETYGEMAVKTLHTAAPEERAARNEAVHGLRYVGRYDDAFARDEHGPYFGFAYSEDAREARIEAGEWNVVLTDAALPEQLLCDVDGPLFRSAQRRGAFAQVNVVRMQPGASPPMVWLQPKSPGALAAKLLGATEKLEAEAFEDALHGRTLVLDKTFSDFNAPRVVATLRRLRAAAGAEDPAAAPLVELLETGWRAAWTPPLAGKDAYNTLEAAAHALVPEGQPPRPLLNAGQRRAFDGAFASPVALVWGPPGTGKSHTLAHILLAKALAARDAGRPLALLVTAFTHHAIVNVLAKTAELAAAYGLEADVVRFVKVLSSSGHAADALLPPSVGRLAADEKARTNLLHTLGQGTGTVIVGATVWGAEVLAASWRGANAPEPSASEPSAQETTPSDVPAEPAVAPLFDGILVDEASQMKLPDALVAFSTLKATGSLLLAGDDQQLPPIIAGTYPKTSEPFLTSVFAFLRHRMNARRDAGDATAEARTLFLLDENFRMNEPLTAYPREVIYKTFRSLQPGIQISLVDDPADEAGDAALLEALLDPSRPVVFVRYAAPLAYTARNPLEADLAARLVARLARRLVDPRTGLAYTPEAFAREGVAVVAPHRAQNGAVRAALASRGFGPDEAGTVVRPMPLVDTVDKAQGQEFDVVVVSYGVADTSYAEAESAFLLSRNRFNVALTRARRKAIVLVSDAVVEVVPTDRQVLLDAMMLKAFDTFCTDGREAFDWPHGPHETVTLRVSWKGFDPAP